VWTGCELSIPQLGCPIAVAWGSEGRSGLQARGVTIEAIQTAADPLGANNPINASPRTTGSDAGGPAEFH
jgi:hypothetical protein